MGWVISSRSKNLKYTSSIFSILLHFITTSSNITVLQNFIDTMEEMIKTDERKSNFSLYCSKQFYTWLIETGFHFFLLKNKKYKNIHSIYFGDLVKNCDEELINKADRAFKSLMNIHQSLVVCYLKERKEKDENQFGYILSWAHYYKFICNYCQTDEKEKNFFISSLDMYIRLLFTKALQKVANLFTSSSINRENVANFSNVIYEYVCFFNDFSNIIFNSEGFLDLNNKTQPFLIPSFLVNWFDPSELFKEKNLEGDDIWSNLTIYERLVTIIMGIDPFFSETSNPDIDKIREIVYGNSDINRFIKTLSILTYSSESKEETIKNKDLDKLKIIEEKNPSFERKNIPILKIVCNFLQITLQMQFNQTYLTFLEKTLFYVIVGSTAINNDKKKKQVNINLSSLNEICFQVISFGLMFLFDSATSKEPNEEIKQKYIHSLNEICFLINAILTHKKLNHVDHSPIYKLFRRKIGIKSPIEEQKNKNNDVDKFQKSYLDSEGNLLKFWEVNFKQNKKIEEKIKGYFNKLIIKSNCELELFETTRIVPLYNYFDWDILGLSNKNIEFHILLGFKTRNCVYNAGDIKILLTPWYHHIEYDQYYSQIHEFAKSSAEKFLEKFKTKELEKEKANKEMMKKYRKIKTLLFSWNGLWSNKQVFYSFPRKFKQKIINHYTKDMTNPLLGPILDIDYYLPTFRYFDKTILFNKEETNVDQSIINKNDKRDYYFVDLNISKILNRFEEQNLSKHEKNHNWYMYGLSQSQFGGDIWMLYCHSKKNIHKDTALSRYKCCLVKKTHHIMGTLIFDLEELIFEFDNQEDKMAFYQGNTDDLDYDNQTNACFGSFFIVYKRDNDNIHLKIKYENINFFLKKRYFYRPNSIEIFTGKQKSYYFHFKSYEERKKAFIELSAKFKNKDEIKMNPKSTDYVYGVINKDRKYKNNKIFTNFVEILGNWRDHLISSFELLMWCNLYSNRSYRDLTQYPVFPWPITNFCGKKIYLPEDYRCFKLPMGMQDFNEKSKERIDLFKKEYANMEEEAKVLQQQQEEEMEDNTQTDNERKSKTSFKLKDDNEVPHFYGTHYSNPIYVSHYLSRLFPFTQLRIELQGNNFDTAERLFTSMETTFESAVTLKTDVRELTPEFFFLPEMFYNINNLNFGIKNTDVSLPPWAKGSAYKFVSRLRKILEKDETEIQSWIDLIFGCKQNGPAAIEACNVFLNSSYYSNVRLEGVKDILTAKYYMKCAEVGLVPSQLFVKMLPSRGTKIRYQITSKKNHLKKVEYSIKSLLNTLDGVFNPLAFKLIGQDNHLVILNENYYKFIIKPSGMAVKAQSLSSLSGEKCNYSRGLSGIISSITNPAIILKNGTRTIQGGLWNATILDFDKGKVNAIHNIVDHSPIVALISDDEENFVIAGTLRGSVIIYDIIDSQPLKLHKKLQNHNDEIITLVVNQNLQTLATSSYDRTVNIYTIPAFKFVNSIRLSIIPTVIAFSSTPSPSLVVGNITNFYAFTINGTPLDVKWRVNEKEKVKKEEKDKRITSYCTFRDLRNKEYLIIGYSFGVIQIRKLPSLKLYDEIEVGTPVMKIGINFDGTFIIGYGLNEFFIINNTYSINQNTSNNLAYLGF